MLPHDIPLERQATFWSLVDRTGECWIWLRPDRFGHDRFTINGNRTYSRRIAWILCKGPISEGYGLVRKCKNLHCVNPDHLVLTHQDDPLTRFNGYIRKTDSCWLWEGGTNQDGYGVFRVRDQDGGYYTIGAHRYMWTHVHGDIPENLVICHKCDVPNCVNPDHLFLGTRQDNNADKVAKNRQAHGEQHAAAKLTLATVTKIREGGFKGMSRKEIADELGVHQYTIGCIIRGVTWKKAA